MDSDNDKHLSEKISTETATETDSVKNVENEPDPDKGVVAQNDSVDSPSKAEEVPEAPISDPDASVGPLESDLEVDQKGSDEIEQEESIPIPPDLKQVSEEIHNYIATLPSMKGDETNLPDVPIFVEQFAVLVEAKVEDYDSGEKHLKWSSLAEEDSASFLEATHLLSSLSRALSEFSSVFKFSYSINRIGGILHRVMAYLEEELKSLVEDYNIPDLDHCKINNNDAKPNKQSASSSSAQDSPAEGQIESEESEQNPPPESEEKDFPGYSEETLSHLIKISKAMMVSGYATECCQVFFIARRKALEESLHKLGFEKHSIDDVQKMNWESLEREIVAWIKTFKQCVSLQLTSECKLCDTVFSDYDSVSESLFSSLSRGLVAQLLNFAGAIALTKRAAEKLFKFLDLYEALRDVIPMVDDAFRGEWVNEVKTEVSMIKSRLGEAIISIFGELETSIKADSGKTPVPGGAVHPLTKYIMNYLTYACDYRETLEQVFREHQKIERADSSTGSEFNYASPAPLPNNDQAAKQSPFQRQMITVMDLLDANLESKSKLYKDPSLSSIFMMNNGRYILQRIKGSNEIHSLMGDSWYRKRSSDLRQYHKGYQRDTWGKLLGCFTAEGLVVNGKVLKPVLKERFKSFNAMFDEIHKTQSTWVVSDEQLQSELRVSISNMVIPAYRSFLGRFSQTFTPGRQTEKYVKYQSEDIETYIDDLFDGNATPMGRKKQ